MQCRLVRAVSLSVLVCCSSQASAQTGDSAPFTTAELVGEWSSGGCRSTVLAEGGEPVNLAREYRFSRTNYVVRYSFFKDQGCEQPTYTFISNGFYELGAPRPDLANTREATVFKESIYYMLQSESERSALGACGPRLKIGELTDVTETGCGPYPPRSTCIGDYELFRVEDGVFYPGLRTPDMCTAAGRPRRTQAVGARQQ